MTIRLKLIGHASTSAIRATAFPADEPLDPQGLQKLAGQKYRLGHADQCWTSPALRASQTAAALGLDATADTTLRDIDYGTWTGRSFEDVQSCEPDALAEWLADPATAPHGGESVLDLMRRVGTWLDAQGGAGAAKVIAVTHASVIRAAIVHAIKAVPLSFWRIDIAPLSVTRLSGNHGRWTLASICALQADAGQHDT